ncbi:hypothetical protein CNE_BB2p03570 (plasmid) [Cupriavidus necator N-1]|uniref:Schlafen AlbA-2 domain-containing protein n=1 Tax=Cupriavidus necator (strain ATCC 43291 / DSM 13513 / CCUG 52238 / LMG 8453 / N-1) TaxID=1042878 RepID=F8GY28_CUPNN|nr:ATP-binding protein [Cupriavidus necator]AEI83152.1 hypothetical protein CNE_BB2p03570 [Cupriavidus necator N-1]MDX6008560.1 ATP-binding protein [Cupriavidus necator]
MEDEALLDSLLYRGEGDALDFKKMQYAFEGADDNHKSELLKDILAFANAWRDTTAYIVIGVNDAREVVGLDKDIDDSRLQQFINGKVNRPIRFHYRSLLYKGTTIGIYTIPLQDRPFFSVRDFGKVAAEAVYVRRGSATALAKPDEIAKMGAAAVQAHRPRLSMRIFGADGEVSASESLAAVVNDLRIPEASEIPDHVDTSPASRFGLTDHFMNEDYFRQVAAYIRQREGLVKFGLLIENLGDAYADDVKLTFRVPASEGFQLMAGDDLERTPRTHWDAVRSHRWSGTVDPSVEISSNADTLTATIWLGKIHAGDRRTTVDLYFSHPPASLSHADVTVHADQLKAPLSFSIPLSFQVNTPPQVTVEQLLEIAHRFDESE